MSVTDGFFRALMSARHYSGPKTFRPARKSTKPKSKARRPKVGKRCVATVRARIVGGRKIAAHQCKLGCPGAGRFCPCHMNK